jgi:hypothetical protein
MPNRSRGRLPSGTAETPCRRSSKQKRLLTTAFTSGLYWLLFLFLMGDYRAVDFRKHDVRLWLPETTDIYMDFLGQRAHRRHSLTDFQLFSVDVAQKTKDPKVE